MPKTFWAKTLIVNINFFKLSYYNIPLLKFVSVLSQKNKLLQFVTEQCQGVVGLKKQL
jgi:hypothetical protein